MPFEQMPPVDLGDENKKKKLKVTVVDESSNLESEAMDIADSKMTESKDGLKGFGGMWKRIWKHNLAQPYYRRKEFEKARAEILERKKLYGDGEKQKAHEKALIEQFSSEHDEAIHADVGEKRELLGADEKNNGTETQIKSEIKKLILDYAKGAVNDETFPEEQTRIFSQIKGIQNDVADKGLLYSSNILEIAKQVKQSLEHGEALDNLDLDFDVIVGKAKSGVRTEAQFNTLDKIIDKIQQSKVGSFVNETTVSAAASIAYCTGAALSRRFVGSKLAAWGSFGATALLGSGIAAAREKKRLEDERKQHFREMAQGEKIEAGSKRREEMEMYRYETKDATSLSNNLEDSLYNFNEKGERETKTLDQQSFQEAIGNLAEIESRIKISDRQKLDLISFSDKSKVTEERLRMDLLRATAKKDLEKLLTSSNGTLALPNGKTFSEFLNSVSESKMTEINGGDSGIEKRNELFNKMRNKKVFKAGIKGLVTGIVIGGAAQEIGAFFRDGQEGLLESFFANNAHAAEAQQAIPAVQSYTVLEYARHWISGDFPRMDASRINEVIINGNHVQLPEGADLVQNDDGTFNLLRGEEVVENHLKFNPDGSLSEEAKKILSEKGIGVNSDTVTSNPKDLVNAHEDLTTKVKRVLWYDNDTPKPVFDKNELKLHWGGQSGTGVDSNGNYVFNMKHMAPDGSYHGKFSVNAQEAMKGGKLKMLLSLSRDTQNQVFEVPIDANGNAVIDPKSEIGKLFFSQEGGKAKFLGKFAEVSEIMGKKDGADVTRILSTLEGKGIGSSTEPITIFNMPQDYIVEPPPFIPILGRRPLEKTKEKNPSIPYYMNYNRPANRELSKILEGRRSSTLKENPKANLDHYKEAEMYFSKFDPEYAKKIDDLAKQAGKMDKNVRMSVCIPAAGHQEGKQIYKTLENFTKQTINPELYEICVFVNHPDQDKQGNKIKPDETLDEIKRFQAKYPQIKVKVIYDVIPIKDANIGRVRKMLNDVVLRRHHNRGNGAKDLIMISNDADNAGVAPKYLENFLDKFEDNPEVDGFLGQLDWDPESYVKYPAIHVGTRLFQYLNSIGRHSSNRMVSSGGNFAFKSSIYSAIGGYLENVQGGEDIAIGQAIAEARKDDSHSRVRFAGTKVSRIYTSSRRAIDAWKSGLSPIEQWERGFSPFDDDIRRLEIDKDINVDYDNPEVIDKLKKQLEYVINRTLDTYEADEKTGKDNKFYKKALGWLGVKYKVDSKGNVEITDMANLIKSLKKYKDTGVSMRDLKSGKKIAKKILSAKR